MPSLSSCTWDIIPIYLYYVYYAVLLLPLCSHKVKALPGPWSGHRHPQLTLIPTKYPEPTQAPTKLPQQMSASIQISSTGIGPGSVISSCRRSSRSGAVIGPNPSDPRSNISNRRQGTNNLHQVAIISLSRRQDYDQLSPTDTSVAWIVSNRRLNSMKYCQPTPGLSNPAPCPPKYVWNIDCQWSYDMLAGGFIRHYERLTDMLSLVPYDWRTPFNVQIPATRFSCRLMLVLWLTLRINPRANCQITTAFSSFPIIHFICSYYSAYKDIFTPFCLLGYMIQSSL